MAVLQSQLADEEELIENVSRRLRLAGASVDSGGEIGAGSLSLVSVEAVVQVRPTDEEGLTENVSRRLRVAGGPVDSGGETGAGSISLATTSD